jgi:hypothetical protein
MRLLKLVALLATLTAVAAVEAAPGAWGPETPNFNLEAILRPSASGPEKGFGLVKFRQPNDATTIVYLDVWVRDLAPNHRYYLERATDSSPVDGFCSGTNWLRLGRGLDAQAIETDANGTGRAELFRGLPALLVGTEFDINFRVVDATTTAVVLQSGCYQYVVSQ